MCLEIITPQTKLVQISCRYCRMNAGLWSSEWNITAPRNIRMTQLVPVVYMGPMRRRKVVSHFVRLRAQTGRGMGKGKVKRRERNE
jgi:hypothetical protein